MFKKEEVLEFLKDTEEKYKKALKRQIEAVQEMQDCQTNMEWARHFLKTRFDIDSKSLFPSGIPSTETLVHNFKNMSAADAAFGIFKENPHPMRLGKIWQMLKEGGKEIRRESIGVILATDSRKRFKRIKPGLFTLADSQEGNVE